MPFLNTIPQPTDVFPQSQAQLLANNVSLDSQFGLEHQPLTSGTGKHSYVTLQQGTSIAPAGTDANIAQSVTSAPYSVPYFSYQNTTDKYSICLCKTENTIAVVAGTNNLIDFTGVGMPACAGMVFVFDKATPDRTVFSPFVFNGTTLYCPSPGTIANPYPAGQLVSGTSFTRFNESGATLQLVSTIVANVTLKIFYTAL